MFHHLVCMQVLADWAISQWAQLNGDAEQSSWSRYGLILSLLALTATLSFTWVTFYALRIRHSSRTLYQAMLTSVLLSPITYFDSTPAGRILNRFTKGIHRLRSEHRLTQLPPCMTDTACMDDAVPWIFNDSLFVSSSVSLSEYGL